MSRTYTLTNPEEMELERPLKKQKTGAESSFASSQPTNPNPNPSILKRAVDYTVKMIVGDATPPNPTNIIPQNSLPTIDEKQPSIPTIDASVPAPMVILPQNTIPRVDVCAPMVIPPPNSTLRDELLKRAADQKSFTIPKFKKAYTAIGILMQKRVGPLQMNTINKAKASEFLKSGVENNHFDNILIEQILEILGPYQEPIKPIKKVNVSKWFGHSDIPELLLHCNEWETDFLNNIVKLSRLTQKQEEVFYRIHNEYISATNDDPLLTKKKENEKGFIDKKQLVEGLVEQTIKEFTPKFIDTMRREFEKELEEFKKLTDVTSISKAMAKSDAIRVYYLLGEDERNQQAVDSILEKKIRINIAGFYKSHQGDFPLEYDCWRPENYVKFGELKSKIEEMLREKNREFLI